MSGINKYIVSEVSKKSKSKGKAYLDEITSALSPTSMAGCNPEEGVETTAQETSEHTLGQEPVGK